MRTLELGKKKNFSVLECSAKENININEAFSLLIDELLKGKDEKKIMEMYSRKKKSDLSISTKKTATNKKSGCC